MVTRQFGGSAKLVSPGSGTYNAGAGDTVNLDKFSLSINKLQEQEGEKITVYFLGFESDEQNGRDRILTDLALDAAVTAAEDIIPGGSLAKFAINALSGQTLEWWREEDILGEHSFVLSKANDWMRGQQYYAQSSNGNLDIYFTILRSADVPSDPSEKVTLTIINDTSIAVERLFISPSNSNSWRENQLTENIPPGETQSFLVPSGIYDLRAETFDGLYRERKAVDLTRSKEWTISD